ncbi:MAG: SAM-dependent chlorinase/fluorinase [Myxococcota bacterium]
MSNARRVVTLLTDFGLEDPYVGSMKGVMLGIAPEIHWVDLTHRVPAQDVDAAALLLWASVEAFPKDTIHLVVVDPGVGSSRRAVAVQTSGGVFVGPDNGVLWPAVQRFPGLRAVVLDRPEVWRDTVSSTFHGRDIFAPVAAHLAAGAALTEVGTPIRDLQPLELFTPEISEQSITGRFVYADHFGNLCTDISSGLLRFWGDVPLRVGFTIEGQSIECVVEQTFSDTDAGDWVVYWNSYGLLEVAIRNGSAASRCVDWRSVPVQLRLGTDGL